MPYWFNSGKLIKTNTHWQGGQTGGDFATLDFFSAPPGIDRDTFGKYGWQGITYRGKNYIFPISVIFPTTANSRLSTLGSGPGFTFFGNGLYGEIGGEPARQFRGGKLFGSYWTTPAAWTPANGDVFYELSDTGYIQHQLSDNSEIFADIINIRLDYYGVVAISCKESEKEDFIAGSLSAPFPAWLSTASGILDTCPVDTLTGDILRPFYDTFGKTRAPRGAGLHDFGVTPGTNYGTRRFMQWRPAVSSQYGQPATINNYGQMGSRFSVDFVGQYNNTDTGYVYGGNRYSGTVYTPGVSYRSPGLATGLIGLESGISSVVNSGNFRIAAMFFCLPGEVNFSDNFRIIGA